MKKFIIMFISLVGCTNSDPAIDDKGESNDNTETEVEQILVDKIDNFHANGSLISSTVNEYDTTHHIIKETSTTSHGSIQETNYIYDNGKIIKKTHLLDAEPLSADVEYFYDGDELIHQVKKELNVISNIYYTFNELGHVTSSFDDKNNNKATIDYIYDADHNVIKKGDNSYEYDDKINFGGLIYPESFYKIYRLSDHNATKIVLPTQTMTFQYEYRDDGYPNEIVLSINEEIVQITKIFYKQVE